MKSRFFLLAIMILSAWQSAAQCSMCKAVAESSSGQTGALALNNGILFLMAIPYVLGAIVAIRWYYHNKAEKSSSY